MAHTYCVIRKKEVPQTKEEMVRQSFLEYIIYSLWYKEEQIDVEVAIRHWRDEVTDTKTWKKKRADIIIYNNTNKDDIKAIIEVKKENENDWEEQLKSYWNVTNASYLIWHNWSDPTKIWKREIINNSWKRVPISSIPYCWMEYWDIIPEISNLKNINNPIWLFRSINSFIWVNSKIKNKKDIFLQFLYLLFIKLYDESFNDNLKFYVLQSELEEIIKIWKSKTFHDRVIWLFNELKNSPEFREIFWVNDNIILEDSLIGEIVYRLQFLKIWWTDTKWEAFQLFISPYYRWENDQFLTPESVIKMILWMLDIDIKHTVIDPACWTWRFLTHTIQHILPRLNEKWISLKEWAAGHIYWIDIDPMLVKISKIYMVLIWDWHTNIIHDNSLSKDISEYSINNKSFDYVITNPPFWVSEKIKDKNILQKYEMWYIWNKDDYTISSTINTKWQWQWILMLERSFQLLKNLWHIAIVLPDWILSNFWDRYIRKWILNNFIIKAVITLPEETFRVKTINASVKTSVLILQKTENKVQNHEIFFACPKSIWYNFQWEDINSNEVLLVSDWYKKWNMENSIKLNLSNSELLDRMDASYYYNITHIEWLELSNFILENWIFTGKTPNKENYLDKWNIKILKVRCLTNKMVDWSDKKRDYVTADWFNKRGDIWTLEVCKDDIIFASAAHVWKYIWDEIDIIDFIPKHYSSVIASAKVNVIRVDRTKINPYVLLLYLRSQEWYNQIQSLIRGQTAEIYPQDILRIKIPFHILQISKNQWLDIENKIKNNIYQIRKNDEDLIKIEEELSLEKHKNIHDVDLIQDEI